VTTSRIWTPDPKLDLVLERVVDVPRELVWAAWTQPEHIVKWFTPAPWKTIAAEVDLRPGGIFKTIMLSPDGQEYPNVGCVLEAVTNERLVMTDTLKSEGKGTRYTATAIHGDEAARNKHEEMGFHHGWGAALDQLVDLMRAR